MCSLLAACSVGGTAGDESVRLEANRARWERTGLESYQYDLEKWCFCLPGLHPARIIVRDDTVAAVLDPATGEPLPAPQSDGTALEKHPDEYPRIEELFEVVERAIQKEYASLNVQYNERRGYPERIEMEISEDAVDDRLRYLVKSFAAK